MRKLCNMYTMIHCSFFIFFFGGLATISYYSNNSSQGVAISNNFIVTPISYYSNNSGQGVAVSNNFNVTPTIASTCDLFSGRWVHDNKSHYPLYEEHECPHLDGSYACQTYGRKDFKYLQWRWQPHDCDFPRFDGKAIVERLRGKRIMFVGDSLVRNQRNSMICMLYTSIPGVKRIGGELIGSLHTFRFTDYNISIDFYWAPMLVESNGDSPTDHLTAFRIVRIKSIQKHAKHWVNSDILIFNSYRWWRSHVVNFLKSGGSLLDDPNNVYEEVNRVRAYKLGLKTWSNWAHTHIDPSKTKLFFMSATAVHVRANEWGGMSTMNCYGETEPVMDDRFWEGQTDPKMLSILESSLHNLKAKGVNVQIINITQLTQCRKDAHPALYRKHWRPLTDEQKKNPQLASDCSHWCLPGVPDIWNELLLAYIFQ